MPPTSQPPSPQVPDVFGQFLDPRVAQQNTLDQYQQGQQIQNQSRQFSGREGALGNTAGLLSKFIEGASIGRANADAKTAHNEAMKSAQDANRLNSYIDMVHNDPNMDPGAKQILIQKAMDHQGKMAETILQESDSPIAKMLHPLLTLMKGGDPADISTKTDSKTGKKSKVKTSYQGPDENVYTSLMDDYHLAAKDMTVDKVSTQKTQDMMTEANKVISNLTSVLGREPNKEEAARALRESPVYNQGETFKQMYNRNNPIADLIGTYQPKLYGTQLLQQADAEEKIQFMNQEKQMMGGGGQSTLPQTQSPPSPQQFGLAPGAGPASRIPPMTLKTGQGPASRVGNTFDTKLNPEEETAFRAWKAKYAPKDSGDDYDLRGAFKAGLTPDPKTGHWPDTFKKPNHPTFSDQSQYANDAPEKAGHWEGDKYIPPTQAQKDVAAPPSAQAKTGTVDPSFLDRAVQMGRAERQESVIDGDKQIPTVRWNGKTYDGDGNVIQASKIGKIITGPRGTPIRVEQTDKDGGKYAVYAFNDGSGKLSIPKNDSGEPYRVPKTEAGLRGQITEVFQTVQQLQRQIFTEQNKLQTIEKDVANDFTIPPSKKAAEVARRRAELQPRIDQMNKNLEANQKILMQYGGPGALYDTGLGSAPPPNQYIDQLDQLQ